MFVLVFFLGMFLGSSLPVNLPRSTWAAAAHVPQLTATAFHAAGVSDRPGSGWGLYSNISTVTYSTTGDEGAQAAEAPPVLSLAGWTPSGMAARFRSQLSRPAPPARIVAVTCPRDACNGPPAVNSATAGATESR